MSSSTIANRIGQLLEPYAEKANSALRRWLDDEDVPASLAEAMQYVVYNGGKRLRPSLVILSAEAVNDCKNWIVDPTPAAVAVEMVHCYSLVHDDLPAMDNDDLRRGKPTCHVKFGEAMAILVGDALLTRAFEVISRGISNERIATKLVAELASSAGPAGLIAGQVADMALFEVPQNLAGMHYIHEHKTAALLRCSTRMGGICAGATEEQLEALSKYGEKIGLAFQIIDDLLDVIGSVDTLGKTPGKDARLGKKTYITSMNHDQARQLVNELTLQAGEALEIFGHRADKLKELAILLSHRDR
ncbi:MAG: polyprenyl synthetase family protein [Planctomycetes bacterium]|nr:polyprenyl synthetase family protein [Planctomycetota bacterium]